MVGWQSADRRYWSHNVNLTKIRKSARFTTAIGKILTSNLQNQKVVSQSISVICQSISVIFGQSMVKYRQFFQSRGSHC